MQAELYRGFIEEVFIRPMRSVLIVDDDYPTLEDMLLGRGENDGKKWRDNREAVRNVINGFHNTDPPLVVDVHDGSNVDAVGDQQAAAYLHQSDLLVLDFELDKTKKEDGTLSIGILNRILRNQQFNLVVLHTLADLQIVFPAVLKAILPPAPPFITEEEFDEVQGLFVSRQIEDGHGDFYTGLAAQIATDLYLYFRENGYAWPPRKSRERPDYSFLTRAAADLDQDSEAGRSKIARYMLRRWESENLTPDVGDPLPGEIRWSAKEPRWIRCESGFIAFTNKSPEGTLLEDLTEALIDWGPPPSRLFLSKMRAELDKAGVVAEGKALGNSKVLAYWYKALLMGSGPARDTMIAATVSRHTDMLMDDILPEVRSFATRILDAEENAAEKADAICMAHFGVDLSVLEDRKAAMKEHNAFVCSKSPEGHHLVTGHIFKGNGDYWVCLTPLCDLVPEQGRIRSGDSQPFLAAKLTKTRGLGVPDSITEGATVMLKLEGEGPTGYSIAAESNSQPFWRTYYAPDQGRITDDAIDLYFLEEDVETKLPALRQEKFTRVGQLRYEYALSLMHRLGSSMTRVGLDFEKT